MALTEIASRSGRLLRPRMPKLPPGFLRPDRAHDRGPGMRRRGLRLTRVETYVLTRTLIGVGGALGVLVAIVMLIDFVELSRTVGTNRFHVVTPTDVLNLTFLGTPSKMIQLLPFAFLFGVLAAYVNLNRRSELVALRAAGVSAWRFIFPAAGAAVAIGVATVLVLNPIASGCDRVYNKVYTQLTAPPGVVTDKALWLRQGDRHTQIIIRAESRGPDGVDLRHVTLFVYRVDPSGASRFSRRIEADQAVLQRRRWLLSGVREAAPGGQALNIPAITIASTLNERTALQHFDSAGDAPFWSLPFVIARTERAGFSANLYRMQFDALLATPIMFAGMSVLAAAFSLRLLRLGGLAGFAGSGVALGFLLFFFQQFCSALGKAEVIPPFLAAWAPPLIALLGGFTLLCYTEDG
jgi:lipopolysaccharide export system permease protein